ncbi:MAG: hypothetical protein WDZ94_03775 [Patescibacteria group bacterium]
MNTDNSTNALKKQTASGTEAPLETPLRDGAPEQPNKLETDMIGVIEIQWQLAEDIRQLAIDLGVTDADESQFFEVPPDIRQAVELQSEFAEKQEELKNATLESDRIHIQEQLVRLYVEFSYNTILLLKKNFNARLRQLTATPDSSVDGELEQELSKTDALITLLHESGTLLAKLEVFKFDTENIFRKVDLASLEISPDSQEESSAADKTVQSTEIRLKELLYELNQVLYVQLGKNTADLPDFDQLQARVLPDQIEKLTEIKPEVIAELLEHLSSYKEQLLKEIYEANRPTSYESQDTELTDQQNEIQAEVADTFELHQEGENTNDTNDDQQRSFSFPKSNQRNQAA